MSDFSAAIEAVAGATDDLKRDNDRAERMTQFKARQKFEREMYTSWLVISEPQICTGNAWRGLDKQRYF